MALGLDWAGCTIFVWMYFKPVSWECIKGEPGCKFREHDRGGGGGLTPSYFFFGSTYILPSGLALELFYAFRTLLNTFTRHLNKFLCWATDNSSISPVSRAWIGAPLHEHHSPSTLE